MERFDLGAGSSPEQPLVMEPRFDYTKNSSATTFKTEQLGARDKN